jgi:hypothetical protein
MKKATRIMISTIGAFVGLMGVEHGIGEVLQGRTAPDGVFIQSWPESEFFHILGGEPALTILPDLFLTGVLAISFSLAYLAWAVLFAHRNNGGWILILLAACMLLSGGGIFPPLFGIFIGAVATRLQAPLGSLRNYLSPRLAGLLGKLWPWSLATCLLAWLSMFPGVPLLNYFFGFDNELLIFSLLFCMIGSLILSFVTALASDLSKPIPSARLVPDSLK